MQATPTPTYCSSGVSIAARWLADCINPACRAAPVGGAVGPPVEVLGEVTEAAGERRDAQQPDEILMLERVGGAELTPAHAVAASARVEFDANGASPRAARSAFNRPTSSEAIVDSRLLPTRSGSMTNTPFSPAVCTAPKLVASQ